MPWTFEPGQQGFLVLPGGVFAIQIEECEQEHATFHVEHKADGKEAAAAESLILKHHVNLQRSARRDSGG